MGRRVEWIKILKYHIRQLAIVILFVTATTACHPALSGVDAAPAKKGCTMDEHCEVGKFCYGRTSSCVPCIDCNAYKRNAKFSFYGGSSCAKSKFECGDCLPGYTDIGDHCDYDPYSTENEIASDSSEYATTLNGTMWTEANAITVAIPIVLAFILIPLFLFGVSMCRRFYPSVHVIVTPAYPDSNENDPSVANERSDSFSTGCNQMAASDYEVDIEDFSPTAPLWEGSPRSCSTACLAIPDNQNAFQPRKASSPLQKQPIPFQIGNGAGSWADQSADDPESLECRDSSFHSQDSTDGPASAVDEDDESMIPPEDPNRMAAERAEVPDQQGFLLEFYVSFSFAPPVQVPVNDLQPNSDADQSSPLPSQEISIDLTAANPGVPLSQSAAYLSETSTDMGFDDDSVPNSASLSNEHDLVDDSGLEASDSHVVPDASDINNSGEPGSMPFHTPGGSMNVDMEVNDH